MPSVLNDFATRRYGRRCNKNNKRCALSIMEVGHNLHEFNLHELPKSAIRSCFGLNLRNSICNPSSISETHYDWSAGGFGKGRVIPSPLQAAIQTATIFNGIAVGKDGILLSQNERAETGLLGKTIKEGQSRQAVKIERMLDKTDFGSINFEDSRQVERQRNPSSPSPQFLIVRGRFDDFSRLVTEGAGILRKKTSLCWLPRVALNRLSGYCSTKDIVNLSQSCKIMHQNMKQTCRVRTRERRRLSKKFRRRDPSNDGRRPQQK